MGFWNHFQSIVGLFKKPGAVKSGRCRQIKSWPGCSGVREKNRDWLLRTFSYIRAGALKISKQHRLQHSNVRRYWMQIFTPEVHICRPLCDAGRGPKALEEIRGHPNISAAMHYAHLGLEHKKEAVKLLDGLTTSDCLSFYVTNPEKSGLPRNSQRQQICSPLFF